MCEQDRTIVLAHIFPTTMPYTMCEYALHMQFVMWCVVWNIGVYCAHQTELLFNALFFVSVFFCILGFLVCSWKFGHRIIGQWKEEEMIESKRNCTYLQLSQILFKCFVSFRIKPGRCSYQIFLFKILRRSGTHFWFKWQRNHWPDTNVDQALT